MRVKIITKNGSRKTYHTVEELKDDDFIVWKKEGDLRVIDTKETAKNLEEFWAFELQDKVYKIIFQGVVSFAAVKFNEDREIEATENV